MKPFRLAPLLMMLAAPLAAQPPMSAAEFESYTAGKTLYFGQGGAPYGVERYLPGRRVEWSFLDGRCKQGEWYEAQSGQICFVYEDEPDRHCWSFFRGPDGLMAQFGDEPDTVPLYEARQDDKPMVCLGPEVGV